MEDLVSQLIALITDADNAIENIDELGNNLEHVLNTCGAEAIEEYGDYLARACNLMQQIEEAITNDTRPDSIAEKLPGSTLLNNVLFFEMLNEHSEKLTQLCPEILPTTIINHTIDQLLKTRDTLIANGNGWFGPDDINRNAILEKITPLRELVCRANTNFNTAVERLTLQQYRDILAETSGMLKDVVIVGADIVVLTADVTLTTAAKSGYSIFTGVRSLGNRLGRYAEKFGHYFNG